MCFSAKSVLVWLVVVWGCAVLPAQQSVVVSQNSYVDEVLKWRAAHEDRFRSPTGWLALTGHFWLDEGNNLVGSRQDCTVQLPKDAAKEVVGKFRMHGDKIWLDAEPDSQLLADGKQVTSLELPINGLVPESDCAIELKVGERLKLQLVRRVGRYAVRVRDRESPTLTAFQGKTWFEVDPQYRLKAKYVPQAKKLQITNIKGDTVESQFSGSLEFQWQGQTLTLDVIQESPDSLFVIFKDRTSGRTTYGAGRFVDVDLPADESGHVVLDFNKTYSPPCAWSTHTLCPVPPKQNHLPIEIQAGEKLPAK